MEFAQDEATLNVFDAAISSPERQTTTGVWTGRYNTGCLDAAIFPPKRLTTTRGRTGQDDATPDVFLKAAPSPLRLR